MFGHVWRQSRRVLEADTTAKNSMFIADADHRSSRISLLSIISLPPPPTIHLPSFAVEQAMTQPIRGRRRTTQPVSDDADEWEDVTNSNIVEHIARSSSPADSSRSNATSPRKRRTPGDRTVFVATQKRPQQRVKSSTAPSSGESTPRPSRAPREPLVNWEEVQHNSARTVLSVLKFVVWDVGRMCIILLKWPFAIAIVLFLLSLLVTQISQTIRTTLSPLCIVPGFGFICAPPPSIFTSPPILSKDGKPVQGPPQWADYPRLMNVQSKTFETLLEEAVDGPGLALEIKKAEMATTDLATLVRVSELKSKDRLVASLGDFVEDARKAGRGLTRFSSKVGGAVDKSVHQFSLNTGILIRL